MDKPRSDSAHGWLFRAVPRNGPWPPRYFVAGSSALEEVRQLVQSHPEVGDNTIEAVGHVSTANMIEFEVARERSGKLTRRLT